MFDEEFYAESQIGLALCVLIRLFRSNYMPCNVGEPNNDNDNDNDSVIVQRLFWLVKEICKNFSSIFENNRLAENLYSNLYSKRFSSRILKCDAWRMA
jgi:hypothetical protein